MSQSHELTEGNDMTTNDADSLSWEDWLGTVDRDLMQRIGQGHERLEDWPWRAAYESGMSPWVAADRMVEDMLSGSGLDFRQRPAGAPASWARPC